MSNPELESMKQILAKHGPGAFASALGGYVIEQTFEDKSGLDLAALAGVAVSMALLNLANATFAAATTRAPGIQVPSNFDPRGGMRQ